MATLKIYNINTQPGNGYITQILGEAPEKEKEDNYIFASSKEEAISIFNNRCGNTSKYLSEIDKYEDTIDRDSWYY